MEYEAAVVEAIQDAIMGSELTTEWKDLRSLMVAAQRDHRQEKHGYVVSMGWVAVVFLVLMLVSGIYFTRMRGQASSHA
jgi:heme/copper-type cytochrome/quinol oxidase subunit 2